MVEPVRSSTSETLASLRPAVRAIVDHLCRGECHAFGDVVEWCEARGDCHYAVACPACAKQFLVDEDELAELERWTNAEGTALVCGVIWE